MDDLLFQSFGSGSSGNCYFVGTATRGILIDAGIGVRTIRKHLRNMGLDFHNIWGIFVTHDHADHIRAVGSLGERYHIPVYTTPEIHVGINRNYGVTEKLKTCQRYVEKNVPFQLAEFRITPFPLSHDSTDCVGYFIKYNDKTITFATDLGTTNEHLARFIQQSNHLVFEANYDVEMLLHGSYPEYLKTRILSDTGHLSNDDCGIFLARNYHKELKNIFLCHLSKENNTPRLAYDTVSQYLEQAGIRVGTDVALQPLSRTTPSELYKL